MFSARSESKRQLSIYAALATLIASTIALLPVGTEKAEAGYNDASCDLGSLGAAGDGLSDATAWEITNPDQLWEITDCTGHHFELTQNIDANDATSAPTISPIGRNSSTCDSLSGGGGIPFTGILNGNSHRISGLNITGDCFVGLFFKLQNAEVRDLVVEGSFSNPVVPPSLPGQYDAKLPTGGLAGIASGAVTVSSVAMQVSVSAQWLAGGLFGQVLAGGSAYIERASFEGNLQARGGSCSDDDYFLYPPPVGGFVALSEGSLTIRNSTSSGEISVSLCAQAAGGFVGSQVDAPIELLNLHRSGSISNGPGSEYGATGGIWGRIALSFNQFATLSNLVNQGNVSGDMDTGGLGGYLYGAGALSNSSNQGDVSGRKFVGGVIGHVDGNFPITPLERLSNLGDVQASGDMVGGLFGKFVPDLSISQSHNSGNVAGNELSGGLVGRAFGDLSLQSSFNSGTVSSSTQNSGGLFAVADGDVSVIESYNAGLVTAPSGTDGLFVSANSATDSRTYSIQDSQFMSASTLTQLQDQDTFVDWDFDDVWFMGCSDNRLLPILQWSAGSIFDDSCIGGSQVIQAPPAQTPATADVPTPPSYNGPIVNSTPIITAPGETFVLSGSRLGGITQVIVNGVSLDVVASSEAELVIRLNLGAQTGIFDLVIISTYGRLTVMDAISIRNLETKVESYGELLGFRWAATFIGNSRSLSPAQTEGILGHLNAFDSATTIVCWGYTTSETPNDWAIAHANARAKAVCDQLAASGSNARLLVRVRYGMPKFAAMRATMQFWELKSDQ